MMDRLYMIGFCFGVGAAAGKLTRGDEVMCMLFLLYAFMCLILLSIHDLRPKPSQVQSTDDFRQGSWNRFLRLVSGEGPLVQEKRAERAQQSLSNSLNRVTDKLADVSRRQQDVEQD